MVAANLKLITATIKIGTEDYSTHIQDYSYDPTSTPVEVTDVSGQVHKFAGESGWDLTLNVFQDYGTTGFARKCFDEEGTKVTIVIEGPDETLTSEITLVAGKIGGATKSVGVSPITFPSSKPSITDTV
jgi:hypothetical protein